MVICDITRLAHRDYKYAVYALKFYRTSRSFSQEYKPARKWKNSLHVYAYSMKWGSTNELARFIARNVIFNQNGLVVVNKPYGIGKEEPVMKKSKLVQEKTLNTAGVGQDYYFVNLLSVLSRLCGYDELEVIKIPERYTSGVTILSSSEELTHHVNECFKLGKAQGKLLDKYWLVCVNQPQPPHSSAKFAIQYELDKVSNTSKPYLSTSWSNNAVKRGEAVPVRVEHSTLFENSMASLVEVKPSRTKAHFLRLYMSQVLSPILGDNIYGSLVQKIGGVPILINPFSERAKIPPRLPDDFLSFLSLKRTDEIFIPTHSHLREVTIPNFYGKEKSLVLESPVPEFFDWTCKQLSLKQSLAKDVTDLKC